METQIFCPRELKSGYIPTLPVDDSNKPTMHSSPLRSSSIRRNRRGAPRDRIGRDGKMRSDPCLGADGNGMARLVHQLARDGVTAPLCALKSE